MPDPNGIAWDDWKAAGYASYEAWIEAHAGDSPPSDWPMLRPPPFPADDEARVEGDA